MNNEGQNMHIGALVEKKGTKGTIGIIIERPAIRGCWVVRWTAGPNAGKVSLHSEDTLKVRRLT